MQRLCQVCQVKPGIVVRVVPDPYYGYGHYPKLCCDNCVPPGRDPIWYESHEYDPDRDDYYLGFVTEKPLDWMYRVGTTRCYDCKDLITTQKQGYGYVYETKDDHRGLPNLVYYCQRCYRARKGVGRINLNELPLYKQRILRSFSSKPHQNT